MDSRRDRFVPRPARSRRAKYIPDNLMTCGQEPHRPSVNANPRAIASRVAEACAFLVSSLRIPSQLRNVDEIPARRRISVGVGFWPQLFLDRITRNMPTTPRRLHPRLSATTTRRPSPANRPKPAANVRPPRRAKSRRGVGTRILVTARTAAQRQQLAGQVATELNRGLVCVHLTEMVRPFIGETEKNLRRLFDSAEASGAILFFDAADALFGRRNDVKDSHDRYANQEISYLLERLERSPAVVILATNRKENIDDAFQRRLRFSIRLTPRETRR